MHDFLDLVEGVHRIVPAIFVHFHEGRRDQPERSKQAVGHFRFAQVVDRICERPV